MLLDVNPFSPALPVKVCTTCGEVKPHSEFNKSRAKNDGLHPVCKECDHKRRRARYAEHAEDERAGARQRYTDNRDEKLAWQRADRAVNPEKYRARDRKRDRERRNERNRGYYAADPEKYRQQARESQSRHKERRSAYNREYRQSNIDQLNENHRKYYKGNKDVFRAAHQRRKARKRGLPNTMNVADIGFAFERFNHCCAACGQQLNGLFHRDHLDHWIPLKSPDCPGTVAHNMVPLCSVCNLSKGAKMPADWLIATFGPRKGRAIQRKIEAFLDSRRPDSEQSA